MKRLLIFFSILIVGTIAYVDAKDRLEELDEVAANTPSQVEMKIQTDPAAPAKIKTDIDKIQPNINNDTQKIHEKLQQDSIKLQEKFDSVQQKRNTITTPVQ